MIWHNSTCIKKGCAEKSIGNALIEMMNQIGYGFYLTTP